MEWAKRPYKLSEIVEWKFRAADLPLTGKIVTARDFGEDPGGKVNYKEQLDHNLRKVFEPFGPVVHVDQPTRDAEVTFYHPFAFYRMLVGGKARIRNFFQDDDFPKSLGISLCDYMDNVILWFAGCPKIEETKADEFLLHITNHLVRSTMNRFTFDVYHDQSRRELIACPTVRKNKEESLPPYAALNETREMIAHLSRSLNAETFTWNGEERRMLVRGATSEYEGKWKERRGLPLTTTEKKQMDWTDYFLKKGQANDALSYPLTETEKEVPTTSTHKRRATSDSTLMLTTVGATKRLKKENFNGYSHNRQQARQGSSSSSDTAQRSSSTASMKLPSPVNSEADMPSPEDNDFVPPAPLSDTSSRSRDPYLANDSGNAAELNNIEIVDVDVILFEDDEEKIRPLLPLPTCALKVDPRKWVASVDPQVIKVLKRIFAMNHSGVELGSTFSLDLTEFDIKSIQKRLKTWGFSQKNKRNTGTKKENIYYRANEFKKDSHGTLPFYDASNSLDERELASMPEYEFIDTTEMDSEYRNDPMRLFARVFDIDCETACDPAVGCQPETCPCMRNSSLVNNVVDDSRRVNQIVECCSKCPCSGRVDACPSIVRYRKLKFHVVHLENMGFALRIMQPVQRGEPLLEFTGMRTNYVSDLDSKWAYTSANCTMQKTRKFTGIGDHSANFLINPLSKGNAARFICHSYFANAAWITLYRGGMKTVDPEAVVYAMEPMEAGEIVYINYGKEFGIEKSGCRCTQELCHDEEIIKRIKGYTWEQGMMVLKERELEKRKRIVEREFQAKFKCFND